MTLIAAVVFALMTVCGQACGQPTQEIVPEQEQAATQTPHIVPTWLSKATGDDVKRVYPPDALHRGVAGIVLVQCNVTSQGEMADCTVAQEA